MGNMITATVASATERASATSFLWGHTGGAPATDRRFAISEFLNKNPSGDVFHTGGSLTGTTIGTKSPRYVFQADSGTVGNGGEIVWLASGDTNTERWAAISGHIISNTGSGATGDLVIATKALATDTVLLPRIRFTAASAVQPGVDNAQTLGAGSFRWSTVYAGSGSINTSDLRDKTDIEDIPDPLLDAWANVRWVLYRFKDGTRIHAGQVAQWVHKELEKAGIDAFAYGLVGKDEWKAEHEAITEQVEVEDVEVVYERTGKTVEIDGVECELSQRVEKPITRIEERDTGETRVRVKAGDRWNLRPDECQAVEAAWNRREHKRLTSRIDALEARLAALEPAA